VGSVGVVLDAPVFRQYLDFEHAAELFGGEEFVAETAVERLTGVPFCQGEAGSMNDGSTPVNRHQSVMACAVISVPLSIRMWAGVRPVLVMMSSSTAHSWSALQERNGRVAKASRVYSSMMFRNRTWRPSTVRSV